MNKEQINSKLEACCKLLEQNKVAEWRTWAGSLHGRFFYFIIGVLYTLLVGVTGASLFLTFVIAIASVVLINVVWTSGEQLREYKDLKQIVDQMTANVQEEQ